MFDSNFPEYRQYTVPQHGMFSPTTSAIEELKTGMDKAYQKFKGTWVEPESSKEDNQAGAMLSLPQ